MMQSNSTLGLDDAVIKKPLTALAPSATLLTQSLIARFFLHFPLQRLKEVGVGEASRVDDVVVDGEPNYDGYHRPNKGVVNFLGKTAAALIVEKGTARGWADRGT